MATAASGEIGGEPVVVFESHELERTEEFLSTHYTPMRIASTSRRSLTRIT